MDLNQTIGQVMAGKMSVTVGHFITPEGPVRFGLKRSAQYGVKPSYDGRTGRGGGFDAGRWSLIDLLRHEFGANMRPDVTLVIGGKEYRREDFAGPLSWETAR